MTSSTHTTVVTPIPASTEKSSPAYPSPAGFLGRSPIIGLALLLLGGMIFGLLAFNVRTNGPLLVWDLPIDQALHAYATHDSRLGFMAMRAAGTLGRETAMIIIVLLGLYWLWKRHGYEFSMLLFGVVGGTAWFELLSHLIGRHRPVWPDPLDPLPGPGFPSGHSITSMLLYGLILYLLYNHLPSWGWRVLAALATALIIFLVGFSRLYMGSHYPTDVLGGYAFGLAWGALVYTSIELIRQRRTALSSKATAIERAI